MVWQSFLLGIAQGVICMGVCFPVMGTYLLSRERTVGKGLKVIVLFLAGRYLGYIFFAVFSAIAGKLLMRFSFSLNLFPFIYIILGVLMILYGTSEVFSRFHVCRSVNMKYQSPAYGIIAGFLTGINLCPPFLSLMVMTMEKADILRSIIVFSVFFAATSIYLIPVALISSFSKSSTIRRSAVLASFIAGIVFVVKGIKTFLI